MIALLNLLPVILFVAGIFISAKRKSWKLACLTVALVLLYVQLQPSYMPKGEIKRSEIPAFEQSDSKIEDRNAKPMSGDERDKRMTDSVKRGLDFIEKDN